MSGHSKWHSIRHKKGAADAKRGKVYTRHARLIEIAARQGGGDPDGNPSLRTAIDNAKADNVPNANIDRAIKKGSGENKGEAMAEVLYAAYLPIHSSATEGGPGGAAFLIECLTDNRNRTLGNIRLIVNKRGGNFAETGSVQWMFDHKGMVVAKPGEEGVKLTGDDLELGLIELGAENIEIEDDIVEVITDASSWIKVRDYLKEQGYDIESSGMKYVPNQTSDIPDEATGEKIADFMEAIEEDDDVSEVFTNAK